MSRRRSYLLHALSDQSSKSSAQNPADTYHHISHWRPHTADRDAGMTVAKALIFYHQIGMNPSVWPAGGLPFVRASWGLETSIMRTGPSRPPEQAARGDDVLVACDRAIASVRRKADRNERLARASTALIILASAAIPVAIILSTHEHAFFWGKLAPSLLAAVAAVAAGLLQIERPHERWKLYRGYQRRLEVERLRYENEVSPYNVDADARRAHFAARIAELQLRLHDEWAGLVPISADVAARDSAIRPSGADGPRREEGA